MPIDDQLLDHPDGPMRLYEARPDGDARAAVIVIQEAFGVNGHIEDVTRRFAAAGYHAAAPDLFHRAGGGTAPYGDFSKVLPLFEGLDDDALLRDVDAARAALVAAGWSDDVRSASWASAWGAGSASWPRSPCRWVPASASTAAAS